MKHITKFVEFLIESEEWDRDDLEDFIRPLKDIGIEVSVHDKNNGNFGTILSGEYEGREITRIIISLTSLKKVEEGSGTGLNFGTIDDERIWEILDEVCTIKRRLESEKVFIHLTNSTIQLSYLHNQVDTNTLEFKLKKMKSEIDSKHLSAKSDFANGITVRIVDDSVVVNCSMFYTRRKWNSLVRDIDFSDWDLDFKERSGTYVSSTITITPKK